MSIIYFTAAVLFAALSVHSHRRGDVTGGSLSTLTALGFILLAATA